jgi:hypothetical protein
MSTSFKFSIQVFLLVGFFSIAGCMSSGSRITLKTTPPGRVSLVSWDKLDQPGEPLGMSPITIPREKVKNQLLRVEAAGRAPLVIAHVEPGVGDEVLNLPLPKSSVNAPIKDTGGGVSWITLEESNRLNRRLLAISKSLNDRDFLGAKALADEAAAAFPYLAAPLVLGGMASWHAGKLDEARQLLKKAEALDPEDASITSMLKSLP